MNRMMHAHLARRLIDACGGYEAAAAAVGCGKSTLHRYQDVNGDRFMPSNVMATLEAFCGEPIYSAAIADAVQTTRTPSVERSIIRANSDVAALVAEYFAADADGVITPAERTALLQSAMGVNGTLDALIKSLSEPPSENVMPMRKGK